MSYNTARNKWLVGQIWEINIHLSGKPFIPNCSFSKFFSHSTVRAIVFTWIFSQLSIMDPNGSWKGHSWFLVLDVNFVHSFLVTYKPGTMKKIVGTCQTSCSSTVLPLPSQHLPYTELWDWHLESRMDTNGTRIQELTFPGHGTHSTQDGESINTESDFGDSNCTSACATESLRAVDQIPLSLFPHL